ncbi:MAG: glutathione S-transferase family protein, partial [Alphaproteobacteria bacterium]|nr:glutathione S-transferase family protein [Alphaproteobacteria bacterium]
HLYVSLACPWAHRTLIMRRLKGLEGMIGLSVVNWHMGEQGWTFGDGPGVIGDPVGDADFLHQVYTRADPTYSGRVTVPVLWDLEKETIVSNESAEIIRMFNSAFDGVGAGRYDYYPASARAEIDGVNERVYETVNNGVYKAGFATRQDAYEKAAGALFETLDWLDRRLGESRYLVGDRITEADWRLFTTLVRFDAVYHYHFKCNIRRLSDYEALWPYARELYQHDGVSGTVDMQHIKNHYYGSHESVNPAGIVPLGPVVDWDAPHGR